MSYQTCPDCQAECLDDEVRCGVCGARLRDGPTAPATLPPYTWLAGGAIWLDDLAPDLQAQPLPAAPTPAHPPDEPPPPPPVNLTLRSVEVPAPLAGPSVVEPDATEMGVADPLAPRETTTPVYDAIVLPPPSEADRRKKARADRRASVRRARLRVQAAAPANVAAVPEVLVVDVDDGSRAQTVTLLLAFGFGVHSAATAEKALPLLDTRHFVAVFADIALDGGDGGAGIELCRRLKAAPAGANTLLVYVSKSPNAIDRIRAQLAGCDDMIGKPPTRGNVAGVLDTHGVTLPNDARRT